MDRTTGTVRCLQCKNMKARHAFRRMNSTSGKISRKCFDCVLSDYRKRIAFWTRQCNTCHRWRGIQSFYTEHSTICKSCDKRLRSDGISNNRCTFPPQRREWEPNTSLLLTVFAGYSRRFLGKNIPVDISLLCVQFVIALLGPDQWESVGDSNVKMEADNSKLIVLNPIFFNRKIVRGLAMVTCAPYNFLERMLWRLRVHKLGKKVCGPGVCLQSWVHCFYMYHMVYVNSSYTSDIPETVFVSFWICLRQNFTFKIGIRPCKGESNGVAYTLRVANGTFESPNEWVLKDGDVISIMYHVGKLRFAVNGDEYPKKFDVVPARYRLTVELYDCMEMEIL